MGTMCPAAWELNETFLSIWDPTRLEYSWVLPDNFHVHVPVMGVNYVEFKFLGKDYTFQEQVNRPIPTGRSLGANITHSVDGMVVREMTARCMYDRKRITDIAKLRDTIILGKAEKTEDDKMVVTLWGHYLDSGFLSARILDHLNYLNAGHVDMVVVMELIDSLPKNPFQVTHVHDCFGCLPSKGNDLRIQYNNILAAIAKSDLLSFLLSQVLGRIVKVGKLDKDMWKDVFHSNYSLT